MDDPPDGSHRMAQPTPQKSCITQTSRQPSGVERILHLLSVGIILLDRRGRTCFANHSAIEIAHSVRGLTPGETLKAMDDTHQMSLRDMLSKIVHYAQIGQDRVLCYALRRRGQRDSRAELTMVACALDAQDLVTETEAVAAIFISDPQRVSHHSSRLIASQFGLTPAETRIANGLIHGKSPDDIARSLNVSQTTVAFHLRNLYQKTGTHRQAGFVSRVLTATPGIVY